MQAHSSTYKYPSHKQPTHMNCHPLKMLLFSSHLTLILKLINVFILFIKNTGYTQLPCHSVWQWGLSPTKCWECGLSPTNCHFYSNWRYKQFAYPHVGLHQHSDGINSNNLFDQVFAMLSGLHITYTASSSVKPNSYFSPLAVGINLPPAASLYLKIIGIPTKKLPQW